MNMDSLKELMKLLQEAAIPQGSEPARRLTAFLELLTKWNARVNLTSSTEWEVVGPLFREGIWASKLYPQEGGSHLDIGSGAGFPALILKILHPDIRMELVESRGKKSQFLEMAAHSLSLKGVKVHPARLSDCLRHSPEDKRWDCISWKALKLQATDLRQLLRHAHEKTQFMMFHGAEPAWEEIDDVRDRFALERRERVPGRRESYLSIYRALNVER
jgi:16S rRNA (guanine(527)-N(7))-methyltransferase RsmG